MLESDSKECIVKINSLNTTHLFKPLFSKLSIRRNRISKTFIQQILSFYFMYSFIFYFLFLFSIYSFIYLFVLFKYLFTHLFIYSFSGAREKRGGGGGGRCVVDDVVIDTGNPQPNSHSKCTPILILDFRNWPQRDLWTWGSLAHSFPNPSTSR